MVRGIGRTLLIGAGLLCQSAALGQDDIGPADLSPLLACAEIDREIARLECYDDAVAALRAARAERNERQAAPSRVPADTPAARTAAAPDRTRATAVAENSSASAPRVVAERELRAAPSARADTSARADAGANGDRARKVQIVEVRTPIPGRAVFVTSEGEEFVQTSGEIRLYLPDVPFQAEVRPGALGGLFLTPEETRRRIRITTRK